MSQIFHRSTNTISRVSIFGTLFAVGGVLWLFSRFRGWGVLFIGTFTQLLIVSAIALFFVWRLWRRVWGASPAAVPVRMPPS